MSLALSFSPAHAGESSLSPGGQLHRVTSEWFFSPTQPDASRLVHTIEAPDGTTTSRVVPGTEDVNPDISPWVTAEPKASGRAALTWLHWDGADYEIALAIWDGSRWSPMKLLSIGQQDDKRAQIVWGRSGLLHAMWRADYSSGPVYYHMVLDVAGKTLRGPDIVCLPPTETVTEAGGGSNGPPVVSPSDILFSFDLPASLGGGARIYGGRDEPMPITTRTDFVFSGCAKGLDETDTWASGGRVLILFRLDSRLIYTYRESNGWVPYRSLTLGPDLSEDRARDLIKEMLARTDPRTP